MNVKALEILNKGIETGTFPKKLYKFRSFNDFTDKIIIDSELYFASPTSFNDPFDCNLSFRQAYSKAEILKRYKELAKKNPQTTSVGDFKKWAGKDSKSFVKKVSEITNKMVEDSGILSLSKDNKNITMWSHYAHNHTGLVFEFDVTEHYEFFNLYGVVEYKEEYDLLSYTKKREDSLRQLFLTKYVDWEYEQEIRIIDYEKNGPRKFKKSALTTIYFGCKAENSNIEHIKQLCKDNGFEHVEFQKASMEPGKFSINFNPLSKE